MPAGWDQQAGENGKGICAAPDPYREDGAMPKTPTSAKRGGQQRSRKAAPGTKGGGPLTVVRNRRARYDYTIDDVYEAGLALGGTEVKSLREGRASLADAFATVDDGEVWLRAAHIGGYSHGTWTNHAARRTRKLLLNRREIAKIERDVAVAGRTLVPLSIYFSEGYAKVELAVATGKRQYDKRQAIAARDAQREAERAMAARTKRRS